jgi:GrpB-like predicted nucleotidyltransferase (UPF0157 family)
MNKKSRSKDEPEVRNYTSDEYLQEVTIGDRKPRNSTIQLDPYNPRWRSDFVKLSERVCQALGDKVLLLEHVGSTSVEGLSAKPIIDMLLVVLDSTDEGAYVPALEKQGFVLRIREPDWFEHRLLKGTDIRTNLHVFSKDCEQVERMLTFRDRLRSNEADRKLYEMRKKELAARTWRYTQHYADAKSEVIREILTRAKE